MKKLLSMLILGVSLNLAYAQEKPLIDSKEPSEAQKSEFINNIVNQNNNELVMFILKSIEDQGITNTDQKINFVNTFNVYDKVKEEVITAIKANITYSDNEKVSYGRYKLKNCQALKKTLDAKGIPDYYLQDGFCFRQPPYYCYIK